jgi:hypothetical protein
VQTLERIAKEFVIMRKIKVSGCLNCPCEEICTYEVCKLAKEKGFPQLPTESDGECYYHWDGLRKIHSLCSSKVYYDDEFRHRDLFRAPTQSLLQRWLREEKNLYISIIAHAESKSVYYEWEVRYISALGNMNKASSVKTIETYEYNTYELALEAALKYALENLVI